MDITMYAGLSTVGEDCLCEPDDSVLDPAQESGQLGKGSTFDFDFPDIPNPRSATLYQLSEYINHVTNWPAVLELPDGGAFIINKLIGNIKQLRLSNVNQYDQYEYPQYSEVKEIPFDMIELVRSYMLILIKDGKQNGKEFKEMYDLLQFFEAMQRGDRFHINRCIDACAC